MSKIPFQIRDRGRELGSPGPGTDVGYQVPPSASRRQLYDISMFRDGDSEIRGVDNPPFSNPQRFGLNMAQDGHLRTIDSGFRE